MAHWTQYLPPIEGVALTCSERLSAIQAEIERLQALAREQEAQIDRVVRGLWSSRQVATAKALARQADRASKAGGK